MDAILKTFCVVSKWRATGDFAAGESATLQSLSPCTGPTFLKARTVCIMQAHNAKTKTKSHPLVNTF